MRINQKDHDVEDLKLSDLEEEAVTYYDLSSTAVKTIDNYRQVARLFLQAVALSVCLSHVMACHFSAGQSTISMSQSAECEAIISKWYMGSEAMLEMNHAQPSIDSSGPSMLLKHTLNIFYQ
jgi:hypothetical protein